MLERYEKVCKRFLKRKINITVGSVVAILLGTNVFALETKNVEIKDTNTQYEVDNPGFSKWSIDNLIEEVIEIIRVELSQNGITVENSAEYDYENIRSIIGSTIGGNENKITAERVEAVLGTLILGDENKVSMNELESIIGTIVEGDGNEVVLGINKNSAASENGGGGV